jgi:hypothetical protein
MDDADFFLCLPSSQQTTTSDVNTTERKEEKNTNDDDDDDDDNASAKELAMSKTEEEEQSDDSTLLVLQLLSTPRLSKLDDSYTSPPFIINNEPQSLILNQQKFLTPTNNTPCKDEDTMDVVMTTSVPSYKATSLNQQQFFTPMKEKEEDVVVMTLAVSSFKEGVTRCVLEESAIKEKQCLTMTTNLP